jgi:hypothetical protein
MDATKHIEIARLWNEGQTSGQIAQKLGITRNAVIGIVFRERTRRGASIIPVDRKGSGGTPPKPKVSVPKERMVILRVPANVIKLLPKRLEVPPVCEEPAMHPDQPSEPANIVNLRGCRYIVEGGPPEKLLYCNDPKERGSYCEKHAQLCYMPPNYSKKKLNLTNMLNMKKVRVR